jgi:4-amino-4-deoxy-L-arabinose transferase-like glycosyltransferase
MPALCAKRTWLPAILLTALVARLAAIWRFGPSVLRFGDAPDYLSAAASLCFSGSYPDDSSMPFFRAPGLPFFIAASTLCHTSAILVVKAALAIAGTASAGVIWFLTEDLFQDSRASLIASGVAAVYPFFVFQSSDIESEGLFMCLFVTAIWLVLRARRTDSWFAVALAGATAALAALVRPIGLLLLFLLPLAILLANSGNANGSRRSESVLLLCAGATLCLAP